MSDILIRTAIGLGVALLVFFLCERAMKAGNRPGKGAQDDQETGKGDRVHPAA